jgi:hypothetical protein
MKITATGAAKCGNYRDRSIRILGIGFALS